MARIVLGDLKVKFSAAVEPKMPAVAVIRFYPLIDTVVPPSVDP